MDLSKLDASAMHVVSGDEADSSEVDSDDGGSDGDER